MSGDRASVDDFAKTWRDVKRTELRVERLGSLAELESAVAQALEKEPHNMYAWLPLMYARGIFGGNALLGASSNARFATIKPETLADAMRRGAI